MAIGMLRNFGGAPQQGSLKTGTKAGDTVTKHPETTAEAFHNIYQSHQNSQDTAETTKQRATDLTGLWKVYAGGDKSVTGKILEGLEPTINAALNNIVGGDRHYLTRARLIALKSLSGYDPNQGTALPSYIYNRLQGLRRISADRGNFIHVPEKSALERRQLEEIKKDYMLENGAEPSLSMLADLSGFPLNKVSRLMSIYGTTSTSATRGESGDSLVAQKRTATELYNDSFYLDLPEMDKKIYEWSTGYKGSPMLARATMAKRLGISEAAVSQHASKINRMAAKFEQTLTNTIYGRV